MLSSNDQRIQVDTLNDAKIDENGNIYQDGRLVAKIKVVDFQDYNYLENTEILIISLWKVRNLPKAMQR